jgi:hypothetical protein
MKFGINAQVIIALLGALYILMVCREKYRIEYAEGEPVTVDERETEVYSMIRDGRLTPDEAADELANLRDAGVSLTSRSLSVLNVLGLADKARADKKMKEGPKLTEKERLKLKLKLDGEPTLAVMPKPGSPGSADFHPPTVAPIVNKVRRADEPRPLGLAGAKAKKTSVAKAPIVAVKAEKNSIIEEEGQAMIEEEATIEGQAMIEEEATIDEEDIKYLVSDEEAMIEGQVMIEEEGMSTGAIVGITAVSIVALIAIMITMRRLKR